MPVIGLPTNQVNVSFGPGGDVVQNVDRAGRLIEYERPNFVGNGSITIATSLQNAKKIIAYAHLMRVAGYETVVPIGPKQDGSIVSDVSGARIDSGGLQVLDLATLRVSIGEFLYIGSSVACVVRALDPASPSIYPTVENAASLRVQRPIFPLITAFPADRNSVLYDYNREGAVSLQFQWIQAQSDPRVLQAYF